MFEVAPTTKKKSLFLVLLTVALIRLWWFFICCNELYPGGCWWWGGSGDNEWRKGQGCSGRVVQEQGEGMFGELCSSTVTCLDVLSPYSGRVRML